MSTTLASRLKEARVRSGLLQSEVAEKACLTQQRVSAYETGVYSPEIAALTRLADLYGVSLDWLTGREKAVR